MKRREKIFWLVLGAVYVVGLIALIPAHGEICKEGAKTGEEACTAYSLLPFLLVKVGQTLDALSVAITALATIAIAWFTWSLRRSTDKLWDAGERQLKLLADTSAAQSRDMQESIRAAQSAARSAAESAYSERAWMTPDGFDQALATNPILDGVTYPEGIRIAPRWKNAGRSPAIKVQVFTTHRMGRVDDSLIPRFESERSQKEEAGIFGPGMGAQGVQRWICGDDLGYFRLSALRCFIYSRVIYSTVFEPDSEKTSEICFVVDFNGMHVLPDGKTVPRLTYAAIGPQNTAS
jgi:hypothetical protein